MNEPSNSRPTGEYKWINNETKCLIDLYSKYRKKVGTREIRNIKMMWQKIAEELHLQNIFVTPNNCINRWRVLEKNYKKFIDNQTKTGNKCSLYLLKYNMFMIVPIQSVKS